MPRGAPFLDGARGSVLGAPAQDVDTDFEHLLAGDPAVADEALEYFPDAGQLVRESVDVDASMLRVRNT